MSEETKKRAGFWATVFFAAVASFLAGVGTMQMTTAGIVARNTQKLANTEKALEHNDVEHNQMRDEFTRRLTTLVGEQANYVTISREFIATMKADRDVLIQSIKQNEQLLKVLESEHQRPRVP